MGVKTGNRNQDYDWDSIIYSDAIEDRQEIVVEPGARSKAYRGVLRTGALDRCIGVGAYSHENRKAYMTHIAGFSKEPEEFMTELADFVRMIRSDSTDLDSVEFFLGGSSYDTPSIDTDQDSVSGDLSDLNHIGGQRLMAEEYLENHGRNLTVEWGSEDGYTSELLIDMADHPSFLYNRRHNENGNGIPEEEAVWDYDNL